MICLLSLCLKIISFQFQSNSCIKSIASNNCLSGSRPRFKLVWQQIICKGITHCRDARYSFQPGGISMTKSSFLLSILVLMSGKLVITMVVAPLSLTQIMLLNTCERCSSLSTKKITEGVKIERLTWCLFYIVNHRQRSMSELSARVGLSIQATNLHKLLCHQVGHKESGPLGQKK